MWALAVETTQAAGSIALFHDHSLVDARDWQRDGSHSEFITVAASDLLKNQNLSLNNIDRFGVSIGPGSFTGIRVGLNFIRSAAYSLKRPVYATSALTLLAAQVCSLKDSRASVVHVIQFAFRDLFYYQGFEVVDTILVPMSEPAALTITELTAQIKQPGYALGTAFQNFGPELFSQLGDRLLRNPGLKDDVHAKFFSNTDFLDQPQGELLAWNLVVPLYIRASEAEEKLRRGLLKPM